MKKNILLTILFFSLILFLLNNKYYSDIRILDTCYLIYPQKNNINFYGISDIAYNKKEKKLYLLGDRSTLFNFSASFDDKIGELDYLNANKILNDHKDKYKLYSYDTEGLTVSPQNKILVAHERVAGVLEVSPSAKILQRVKLPKKLIANKNYRDKNKMLESIAYHHDYGVLIASEFPLKKDKMQEQTIYSLKGKEWHFKMENYPNSGLASIEVMDDGNLLVLERSYVKGFHPLRITVKKVYINDSLPNQHCHTKVLFSFNSFKGDGFHNFEGLTHVAKNRYLMVSDNNGYRFLPTKLIYFEIKE